MAFQRLTSLGWREAGRPGKPLMLRVSHTWPATALQDSLSKDSLTQEAGPRFPSACYIKHWNFLVFPS